MNAPRFRKQDGMTIQTVICSKDRFESKEEANAWIRDHDFKIKAGAPDETSTSWRYRQREPSEFQDGTFRTIELTDGVSAVVGKLKESKMRTDKSEVEERGADLLLQLNLEPRDVQSFEFAVDKFRSAAAAKSWAKNHGFAPAEPPRQQRDVIVLRVRGEDDFEPGTIRREKLTRDVSVIAGVRKSRPEARKAVPDADATPEEKREAQQARAKKWGIEALEGKGENLSFPAGGPTDEGDFADPVNLKYPVHTEANAANARVRFKQNADVYEEEKSKSIVHERIVRAELSFGIDPGFDPDDPLDALLPGDLKDRLSKLAKCAPVEFAKRGELLIRKQEDGEDPAASVRMLGIVMKPEVPDVEGDVTSEEEIENANFVFMKDFGTLGFMHKKDVSDRVRLIQDVIAPVDFDFPLPDGSSKSIAKGTWYQELFTDDPELVERVRGGTLNGLSIGGKARREPITEMADGEIRLLPDLPFNEQQKRALEEIVTKQNVNKAEGDPALARFHDLRVEEVSLVDAAANEEDFFLIKRRKDMPGQKPNETAADAKKNEPTATIPEAPQADPPAAAETPAQTDPPAEPSIAQQVADGVTAGIKAAIAEGVIAPAQKSAPPAAPPPAEDPVAKGFADLGSRLDGIDKRLDDQDAKLSEASTVRAAAKGQSVPDSTATPEPEENKEPESKWAGTAVHGVFGKRKQSA